MSDTTPTTPEEWAAFLATDAMPLYQRLGFVAALASDEHKRDPEGPRQNGDALKAIIPGDSQATPAILDAVAKLTGQPRIRQGENGIMRTAPAARAALRRWAARTEKGEA